MCLFRIISYSILLPTDIPHSEAVDFDNAINLIPVSEKVIELDVVAIIIDVSNDFNIVVNVSYFLNFCFDL